MTTTPNKPEPHPVATDGVAVRDLVIAHLSPVTVDIPPGRLMTQSLVPGLKAFADMVAPSVFDDSDAEFGAQRLKDALSRAEERELASGSWAFVSGTSGDEPIHETRADADCRWLQGRWPRERYRVVKQTKHPKRADGTVDDGVILAARYVVERFVPRRDAP